MKRLFCIFILALSLICCAPEYGILSYQDGDISAECKINGEYTANIIKSNNTRTLEICEPAELSKISFKYENNEWLAICDDIQIPIEGEYLDGISALCSIFDLEESAITTAKDEDGIGNVSFLMDDTTYLVTYNKQALPEKIKITSDTVALDVEILSISKS